MTTIVNFTPRIIFGSLLAYIISQSFDAWAIHKIKTITGGRWLWLRNNLSTLSSQVIDTAFIYWSRYAFGRRSPQPPDTLGVMLHPSGVITITTDFGHKGPFVAVMQGVIIGRFPAARVIDLAHDIPAQWPPEAGFWVRRAYKYFPPGTVHLAIVDPGVGTERDILIVEYDHHYFLAPDNGLLARMLDDADDATVFKLDLEALERLEIPPPSATFHGRDIFAPIAAEIAAGRTTPVAIGTATNEWIPAWLDNPEVRPGKVSGVIVTIDSFGNLISNIDGDLLAGFKDPVVHIGGHEVRMLQTYGRAQPGHYLALVNSFGVIEVARAEGDAAEGLGAERGAPITVTDGISV